MSVQNQNLMLMKILIESQLHLNIFNSYNMTTLLIKFKPCGIRLKNSESSHAGS